MFNIVDMCNSVNFNVSFKDKVCILCDLSGKGKTFLLKFVQSYCLLNDISCIYLDYNMCYVDRNKIVGLCEGKEIVLLDNADLYLDNDMLNKIEDSSGIILICMKSISKLDMRKPRGIYSVNYKSDSLTVTKRG